jgi:hypothetical protein
MPPGQLIDPINQAEKSRCLARQILKLNFTFTVLGSTLPALHFPIGPSKKQMRTRFSVLLCLFTAACLAQTPQVIIPAGVPLRVQINKRYPITPGTKVEAHLIAPVYLVDHEVLPVNTLVTGSIVATHPVDRSTRTEALLDGDFTPLATPELHFDQITLPDGTIEPIATHVVQRDGSVVRMRSGKKPSMTQQAEEQLKQREHDTLDQITKPGKSDRLLRMFYGELPYHPQRIWPGTQFDAELTAPLTLQPKDPPPPLPTKILDEKSLTGIFEARLTKDLTSATAKQGDVVDAVLTKPLLDSTKKQVLLPEGTHLEGVVLQARHARWFARNGKLRFTFRQVELPQAFIAAQAAPSGPVLQSPTQPSAEHQIHGRMIASEANRQQNVSIDSEGGAQASGGVGKYIAPLALGILASQAGEGDSDNVVKNGVVSNGFGIIARVVTIATANKGVAMGFAYYALSKSVYKRWISKGNELTFPKNTRIQIELSER